MYVRAIVDVPQGAQLTVCHTQVYDPRPVRQAALFQVRTRALGVTDQPGLVPCYKNCWNQCL